MSCNVCIENFNRSSCYPIDCNFCDFRACRRCYETFLLSTNKNAHCMNCKHEWDYKNLLNLFTRKFIDGVYKKHMEVILFNLERELLSATQPIVDEQKRQKKIKAQIKELQDQVRNLNKQINSYKKELENASSFGGIPKTLLVKCNNGNCCGFLNSDWECNICERCVCSKCYELKECSNSCDSGDSRGSHICKLENIETIKLLNQETKTCPRCAFRIFKIDGCDQIFCTQCHTAFDWETGVIINGAIHNPHYFEWLRENNSDERNLLEVRCGREIDHSFISNISFICSRQIIIACEYIIDIRNNELPFYATNIILDNQDLRIKYLNGTLTEEKFKNILQRRYKEKSMNLEIAYILSTYTNSFTEIMYRYLDEYIRLKDSGLTYSIEHKYLYELKNLISYINNCFDDLSNLYKSNNYQIDTGITTFGKFYVV